MSNDLVYSGCYFLPVSLMFSSLHRHSDWGLLALRLAIGVIFLYHGLTKWQMDAASPIMTILKFAEPIGGLALILGVLTQLAALGFVIIMLGAIYMKASGFGQQPLDILGSFAGQGGWEFDLVLLAGCVAVFLSGAGRMSLDALMHAKK